MRPFEVEASDQVRIFTHPAPRAGRNAVFLPTFDWKIVFRKQHK